jgi:hypothetical protein
MRRSRVAELLAAVMVTVGVSTAAVQAQSGTGTGIDLMDVDLMFIGAHPDDDTGIMATFARYLLDEGYKGTVITLTGGEGGGNAIGRETGPIPRPHPAGGRAAVSRDDRCDGAAVHRPAGLLLHPFRGGGSEALGRHLALRRCASRAPRAPRSDPHDVARPRHPRPAPDGGACGHDRLREGGRPHLLRRPDHARVPPALRAREALLLPERSQGSGSCGDSVGRLLAGRCPHVRGHPRHRGVKLPQPGLRSRHASPVRSRVPRCSSLFARACRFPRPRRTCSKVCCVPRPPRLRASASRR